MFYEIYFWFRRRLMIWAWSVLQLSSLHFLKCQGYTGMVKELLIYTLDHRSASKQSQGSSSLLQWSLWKIHAVISSIRKFNYLLLSLSLFIPPQHTSLLNEKPIQNKPSQLVLTHCNACYNFLPLKNITKARQCIFNVFPIMKTLSAYNLRETIVS